ncbi:bifunctional tetrahydrofolate synthase/dihydrofolate synthase [Marinimicrobium sp. ABcell2]|uniref:bifunctional tetrahydrofolate synthase/dihydrofolate synthase n=1 Tax=Marinimicrobium sp. ABcell2 TaxID=3069751 RepID=UPI0027B26648|nr:bifunctional tetrahydrofolate synthase/dihydrofolate synthase [Marinimicrobium sp. ABcell2]MDQ2075537.1 bifunctional tetrahydrofolate synthase/dihydrofolate synthase [Marinimicrobium sp. ABcell2]
MRYDTLDAWLGWLEKRHPREIDLGLDRIREVAGRLNLLEPQARLLTVAGTNGKGSCVAASAYLLGRAGCKVGVYTSPHFQHYCERIAIDGKPVHEDEVCRSFATIDAASEGVSLTYFEFGTLAALDIFRQRGVDIMVLEVGLGGRLDAVNILDADVAVVTGIDLDHQDWLGTSRDSIGREKAGVFRPGQPAICADPTPPQGLLESAEKTGAQLQLVNRDFGFFADPHTWRWWGKGLHEESLSFDQLPLPALPLPSLAAAVQAVSLLGVKLERPWLEGLSRLSLPGRFQRLHHAGREFILDVAHNPAATSYLARGLAAMPALGRTHAVVGMMADKDHRGSLAALTGQVDTWWLAELSHVGRAASTDQLMGVLRAYHAEVAGCGTVVDCIEQCLTQTEEGDRIVILGSFYTVAAALDWLAGQSGEAP